MPLYKIASGDLTNLPLLEYVARLEKPMIISTGGSNFEMIEAAVNAIRKIHNNFAILQCTASYPASFNQLNLRVIEKLRSLYPENVIGYSGHDNGIAMSTVAFTLGTTPLKNEYAFHQPMGKGYTAKSRYKNLVKFRLRNGLKYLLFLLGQYKPRVNPRDLQDQISAVLSIAHSKATEVIWIQHVPAWSMRTYVERWYYRRYISRVKWFAETIKPVGTYFIIPSDELARVKNYAQDTTHLSAEGHRAYFEYFSQLPVIKKLQRA